MGKLLRVSRDTLQRMAQPATLVRQGPLATVLQSKDSANLVTILLMELWSALSVQQELIAVKKARLTVHLLLILILGSFLFLQVYYL